MKKRVPAVFPHDATPDMHCLRGERQAYSAPDPADTLPAPAPADIVRAGETKRRSSR